MAVCTVCTAWPRAIRRARDRNGVSVEVFQRDTGRATYEHAYTLDAETVKGV